jgi:hypothetical protein
MVVVTVAMLASCARTSLPTYLEFVEPALVRKKITGACNVQQ